MRVAQMRLFKFITPWVYLFFFFFSLFLHLYFVPDFSYPFLSWSAYSLMDIYGSSTKLETHLVDNLPRFHSVMFFKNLTAVVITYKKFN